MCVHMEQQKMGEGHFYEEQYLKRIEEYLLICSSHLMSSYSTPVIPGITPVIPDITPLLQYLVIQKYVTHQNIGITINITLNM